MSSLSNVCQSVKSSLQRYRLQMHRIAHSLSKDVVAVFKTAHKTVKLHYMFEAVQEHQPNAHSLYNIYLLYVK